jgi:hypothetical protein
MYASQYFSQISELLRRLPRVILLMLKTNDCLRTVNNSLVSNIFYLFVAHYLTEGSLGSTESHFCLPEELKFNR